MYCIIVYEKFLWMKFLIQFWPDAKIFVTIVHFIYDKKVDFNSAQEEV